MLDQPLRQDASFLLSQLVLAVLADVDQQICCGFVGDLLLRHLHLLGIVLYNLGNPSKVVIHRSSLPHEFYSLVVESIPVLVQMDVDIVVP